MGIFDEDGHKVKIMTKRTYSRLSKSTAKLWLTAGGLLGAGMLPCPDCGTPMIFHVWPLVGLVLVARAIRKRSQAEEPADLDVVSQNSETAFKKLH